MLLRKNHSYTKIKSTIYDDIFPKFLERLVVWIAQEFEIFFITEKIRFIQEWEYWRALHWMVVEFYSVMKPRNMRDTHC